MTNDVSETPQFSQLHPSVSHNLFEVQDQALIESLGRDVIIKNGVWSQSSPEIGLTIPEDQMDKDFLQPALEDLVMPDELLKSAFLKGKLMNVAFMRADVSVSVRVQATPFLQGVLLLWQDPYRSYTSVARRSLNQHLRSITTFPSVQLDLQSQYRLATLKVPYSSEFQVFNPLDTLKLNNIRLSVLSSLHGDEESTLVPYTITARFENIKLYGHAPAVTTTSLLGRPRNVELPHVQMGEDEKATKQGIVSNVTSAVASIADAVSSAGIPVVSSIAKPIGWVAGAVSKVASLFGFSKDTNMEMTHTYCNVPAKGFTNTTGIDNSITLSALPDNAVVPTMTMFSSEDEMAVDYLARIPFLYNRYNWKGNGASNDGDAVGTILADIPIHPCDYSSYGVVRSGYRTIFGPPISMVASLFNWWRGQLKLNLRFAKTQYHQGRLLVQYIPYGSGVQDVEAVLSEFVDLSQVDENGIDISFPTITRNKWLSVFASGVPSLDYLGGRIIISVLTPLNSASTVSTDVQVLPWLSWQDLEFAEPGSQAKVAIGFEYPHVTAGSGVYSLTVKDGDTITMKQTTTVAVTELSGAHYFDLLSSSGLKVPFLKKEAKVGVSTHIVAPDTYIVSTDSDGGVVLADQDFTGPTPVESNGVLYRLSVQANDVVNVVPGARVVVASLQEIQDEPFLIEATTLDKALCANTDAFESNITTTSTGTIQPVITPFGGDPMFAFFELWSTAAMSVNPDGFNQPMVQSGMDFTQGDSSSILTTMGEVVYSLRALCRRFSPLDVLSGSTIKLPGITFDTDSSLRQSTVDIISYLYRFTTGGICFKIIPRNSGMVYVTYTSSGKVNSDSGFEPFDANSAVHIQDTSLNPIVEVKQPFYSPAENLVLDSSTFPQLSDVIVGELFGANNEYLILKAGADDQSFSYAVGCPAFTIGPRL